MRQARLEPGRGRHRAAVLRLRLPHGALAGDAGADRPDALRRGAAGHAHRLCGVVRPAGPRRRGDPALAAGPARRPAGGGLLRHHHPRAGARPGDGAGAAGALLPGVRPGHVDARPDDVRGGARRGAARRRSRAAIGMAVHVRVRRPSRRASSRLVGVGHRLAAGAHRRRSSPALSQVVRRRPGRGARAAPAGPGAGLVGAAVAGHRRADLGGVAGPRRRAAGRRGRCWSPRCWSSAWRCRRRAPSAAITRPTGCRSPSFFAIDNDRAVAAAIVLHAVGFVPTLDRRRVDDGRSKGLSVGSLAATTRETRP